MFRQTWDILASVLLRNVYWAPALFHVLQRMLQCKDEKVWKYRGYSTCHPAHYLYSHHSFRVTWECASFLLLYELEDVFSSTFVFFLWLFPLPLWEPETPVRNRQRQLDDNLGLTWAVLGKVTLWVRCKKEVSSTQRLGEELEHSLERIILEMHQSANMETSKEEKSD